MPPVVGFGSRGGTGPGGSLPASLGDGDLLIGDAAGTWRANLNIPIAGSTGAVPFWDGGVPGRYRYTAAPTDGQTWYFNAGTGLWVPRAPVFSCLFAFGDWTINATSPSFVEPWEGQGLSQTTEANSSPITATRNLTLRRMFARHNSPVLAINLVYTLLVNGVASALTVTLNSGVGGPASDLINTVAVLQGDRLAMQVTHAVGGPFATRTQIQIEAVELP